jgi:hypothetical protein
VPASAQKKPGCLPGLVLFLVLFAGLWIMFASCGHSSHTSTPSTTSTVHHPPTPDERYLYILKSNVAGITNADGDAGLIRGGHAICDGLAEGRSRESIKRQFTQGPGWSDSDASWMITASVAAYCPEYVLPSDKWMDPPS